MTEANHFLAAIIAEPDDDLPRLVFADWLDENGHAERAEFIRLQCLLARTPLPPDERAVVESRTKELEHANRDSWVIPGIRGRQEFRRGFVEYLYTAADDFLLHERHIAKSAPVIDLRISVAAAHLRALAGVPLMAHLRALGFVNDYIAGGLRTIFRPNLFPTLRTLTLRNNRLWADDVATLSRLTDSWPNLQRLDLSGNPFADDGLAAVADAPGLRSLRELVLRSDGLDFHDCVHAGGAAALARSKTLTQLRLLNVAEHHIGDAGFQSLVGSPILQHVERLDVAKNDIGVIGPGWADALTASPHLRRLTHLNLMRNTVDPLAAETLAGWQHLRTGCTVDLRGCELSTAARRSLTASVYADRFLLSAGDPE